MDPNRKQAPFGGIFALVVGECFREVAVFKKAFLMFVMTLSAVASADGQSETFWSEQNLRDNAACLLKITRKKMESDKTSELPTLKFASSTSLTEFQDEIEKWWNFRPEVFVNVYNANTNTLYLTNNKAHYRNSRTPVDSLVHELTHFVQSKDLNASHEDGEYLEEQATRVQTWFRDNYGMHIVNENYQGPCK